MSETTPSEDDSKSSPTVTPSEETPSLLQEERESILISKATGVDYTRLRDLLAEGKWIEADQQTTKAMLQAANRGPFSSLSREDIDIFPCEDLRIIDQLWLDSSKGKFGFSVQKEIWKKVEKVLKPYTPVIEIASKFYIEVGWETNEWGIQENSGWFSELYLESAARGNLPNVVQGAYNLWGFNRGRGMPETERQIAKVQEALLSRTNSCNL